VQIFLRESNIVCYLLLISILIAMHFLWRNIAADIFFFFSSFFFIISKGYTIPEVDNLHYIFESLTKMYLLKTRVCFHKKCNVQSTLPVLSRCMYTIVLYMRARARARVCVCVCVCIYFNIC